MDPGEQTTGTRDEHYNLISVLYHALHGAETTEAYILDAEAAGDERLAAFFREAQAMQRELAERAKGMLGILEVPPEGDVMPDVPPESGIAAAGAATGVVPGSVSADPGEPPRPTDVPPERTTKEAAPGTTSLENEVPRGTPPQAPPGDVQRGDSPSAGDDRTRDVSPSEGEVRGEPGRATTPEQQREASANRPAEGRQEEEEKGLIDKVKDRLMDREEPGRR